MLKKTLLPLLAAALALPMLSTAAFAMRDDQSKARDQFNSGKVLKLREIESRVIPQMKGMEYLGPEYDPDAKVYRLKFINKGRVVFVDVDARTGGVLEKR
jgi:uncharacterized membrane protein YkoI